MNPTETSKEAIKKAIEIAGGVTALANKINVSYHTVLTWKNGRSGVSQINCLKIEEAVNGKVKREEIMPNYPWLASEEKKDERLEIAKNMITKGIDKQTIVEVTKLSEEEIKSIKF